MIRWVIRWVNFPDVSLALPHSSIIPPPFPRCVSFPPASHVSPSNLLIVFSDCSLSCLFLVSVLASIRYFLACISAFHFHSLMFLTSWAQVKTLNTFFLFFSNFSIRPPGFEGSTILPLPIPLLLSPTPFWCLSLNIFFLTVLHFSIQPSRVSGYHLFSCLHNFLCTS